MSMPGGERRSRTQRLVGDLLNERQQLLVAYCRVAGLEPYTSAPDIDVLLRDFCQVLVDYVAAIHFELYSRVEEGSERRERVARVAARLHSRIAETTQFAVEFNDRCEGASGPDTPERLSRDMSRLGEELAARFELEDQLFAALLSPAQTGLATTPG